jgi:hypothetical protein
MNNTTNTEAAASALFTRQMELESEQALVAPRGLRPNRVKHAALANEIAAVRAERQAVLAAR